MPAPGPPLEPRASEPSVRRLSAYYRVLAALQDENAETVSSYALARRAGVTPAQVRKDLSGFGQFGKRGTGYPVTALRREIQGILGLDRPWRMALAGAGNLAHALFAYKEFPAEGFHFLALFDRDPAKIGQPWNGLRVEPVERLVPVAREKAVEIGVITTPAAAAQEVCDLFVEGGVRGILNFAPRKLFVPGHVSLRNVNLAIELESLSFALK
jgi:redox-sensing transcriptional repressor